MRLEIVVFVLLLAIFLYWKSGARISLPNLGNVGAKVGGILGSFSLTSSSTEEFKSRSLWFCILVGAAAFHWGHTAIPLLVFLVIRSFFLPTTNLSVFIRWAYIVMMLIFAFIPGTRDYTLAKWHNFTMATTQMGEEAKNPHVAQKQRPVASQFIKRTAELDAVQDGFTWVRVPDFGKLHNFTCPSGVIMVSVHRYNPSGSTYDCDEGSPIALGDGLLDWHLGFRSKARVIHVVIPVLVPKRS